jgi:hypothetical protein
VARAKRTDRAEARRRYRAQFVEAGADDDQTLEPDESPEPRPAPRGRSAAPALPGRPVPPQRSGIRYAFRAAIRPANLREDLAHLPQILRQRSVWLTTLAIIAVGLVFAVYGGRDIVTGFLFPYFVAPPPVGAIFIAGFFAPRASYIAGAIVGLVAAIVYSALLLGSVNGALPALAVPTVNPTGSPTASASPAGGSPAVSAAPSASPATSGGAASASPSPGASAAGSPDASATPSAQPLTQDELNRFVSENISAAFVISPVSGILFGAAIAWYRRFLNLANPNRGARRPPPNRGKPRR